MKLSEGDIRDIFPEDDIRTCFMQREDIAPLPQDEREKRWSEHRKGVFQFFEMLSRLDCVVVSAEGDIES